MKKVALLTFHDTTNFGALLQTYGLYKKLNDIGIDCRILNYQCENIVKREIPSAFHFSFNPKKLFVELFIRPQFRRRYKAMHMFIDKNMPKITQPYDRRGLIELKEDFDTFVVGSDMLWGVDITNNDYSYFLDFVSDNKNKISYATSIGKREWSEEEANIISNLLNRFSFVSVREDATAQRLHSVLNKECCVVCDPTMLLETKEWTNFIKKDYKLNNYVLVYFNSDDGKLYEDAKKYAYKHGKKLIDITPLPSFYTRTYNVFPYFVEDFLSLLYYADMVFTASYHGLLFSLYFHKNFIYYNRQPAYRMQTIAYRLNIESREGHLIDFDNILPLNYSYIDAKIEEYRKESVNFIKKAFK